MEALLDVLFGNAFFIIIILGIVSSLYKRFKRGGEEGWLKRAYKGARPPGGSPVKTLPTFQDRDIFQEGLPSEKPFAPPVYHDDGLEQAINREHTEAALERKAATARVAAGGSGKAVPQQETPRKVEFGQNQILQGIVMAEILGKPRGYTSRYRRAKSATVFKK